MTNLVMKISELPFLFSRVNSTGRISLIDDICAEVDRLNEGDDSDKTSAMEILQDQEIIVSFAEAFSSFGWGSGERHRFHCRRSGVRIPGRSNRIQCRVTARYCHDVSLKLYCSDSKPWRWIRLLVTRFGVVSRM